MLYEYLNLFEQFSKKLWPIIHNKKNEKLTYHLIVKSHTLK